MARRLVVIGAFFAVTVLSARDTHAQVARHHVSSLTRTAQGARLTIRLQPEQYNTCHVVLAKPGGNVWNGLKQHPITTPIFRDLGTHSIASKQITEMSFELHYDHELFSGQKAILGARFQTNNAGYVHVWGGSSPDTELTMP